MMELYHCANARSFRVLWALEELSLQYRLHMLPFPPRVLEPDYLELNPLGTIPLFIDGDVRLTESTAILQYLATRKGGDLLGVSADHRDFGLWLNWLSFGEATLTVPQTIVLRYTQFEPAPELQRVIDDYTRFFLSRLRHVTRKLLDHQWLCADRFTSADISVGYALLLAQTLGLSDKFSPEISDYWDRLSGRKAFKAAKSAQDKTEWRQA